eukprot:CAMPEP_0175889154 /NCGR_PEP_ID=MMETSP0107_2-20121207/47107_1 /TAXON_ID=195067 ORGANISM="Goniomonas pacifica, Strain CCMP1869" /NCGR_SAMPLE_ID=MMETSP0107_2 /ASSEMBLY_ACC=CAM_ASM_000203 /LENGTH=213 /DNA_ID=CAMNT_0017209761 /DNA_START=963 /DNA_END=1602 /DNA_ORIENTATION=+
MSVAGCNVQWKSPTVATVNSVHIGAPTQAASTPPTLPRVNASKSSKSSFLPPPTPGHRTSKVTWFPFTSSPNVASSATSFPDPLGQSSSRAPCLTASSTTPHVLVIGVVLAKQATLGGPPCSNRTSTFPPDHANGRSTGEICPPPPHPLWHNTPSRCFVTTLAGALNRPCGTESEMRLGKMGRHVTTPDTVDLKLPSQLPTTSSRSKPTFREH